MASNISTIKGKLSGGGSRSNLFKVNMVYPTGITGGNEDVLVKSAGLPSSNLGIIEVPVRGLILKVAGDRTIDTWTVTVINDEGFILRNAFEEWADLIARLDNNIGATDPAAYMTNATVYQLGRGSTPNSTTNAGNANAVLKEYQFIDIFPTQVSQIDLSYDSGDTIEEFTVEFQVQSFTAAGAGGPNG